jgi:dTDP-glucose 4,6-dehydratase
VPLVRGVFLRVLVTGGMGFIGSNFIRYLLSSQGGVEVVNLDNLSYGSNLNNLKDFVGDGRYTFVEGSIADFALVSKLVGDADVVVNFAAETHVDRSIVDPTPFLQTNTFGAFNLLEACRKHRVRLLHVSTDEVYGDIVVGSFTEKDRLNPSNPYSATKAAADLLVVAYHRTYGVDALVTRCTNNFGPYQFPEKLLPKVIVRARLGLKAPVYGSGKNIRDWIYVQDHCEALWTVLQKGRAGEVYNISAGNEYDNLTLVKKVLELMGKDESFIEFVEDRPGHDLRYSLDSTKIRSELGWRPRFNFDEALKFTVEWYLKNEWWWKPLVSEELLHPTPWKLDRTIRVKR